MSNTGRAAPAENLFKTLTPQNVARQLTAMACESYDVLAIHRATGKSWYHGRGKLPDEITNSISMLGAKNAQGCDIYIRPHACVGLILVDDIAAEALRDMTIAGLPPALIVASSPKKLQAWVRVCWEDLTNELKTAVAQEMARRFGGDMGAAKWNQPGRLVGYTNRKPEHRYPDGRPPFARLLGADGALAPDGAVLLANVAASLAAKAEELPTAQDFLRAQRAPCEERPEWEIPSLAAEYRRNMQACLQMSAPSDWSQLDAKMCVRLAYAHPEADEVELARAIIAGSLNPKVRSGQHDWNWCRLTARKALSWARRDGS